MDRYHLLVFVFVFSPLVFTSHVYTSFFPLGFFSLQELFFFIVVLKSCIIFEGAGNTLMVPVGWELIILYSLRQYVNLPNGV